MVLMPEFKNEIIPFAKLAVDLGVDYGVIKHCSDDEFGTLGVDYTKYEKMYNLLDEAEKQSINDKVNYGPYSRASTDWELYEKNYTMYPFFKKWMIISFI